VLLVFPDDDQRWHGAEETAAFAHLTGGTEDRRRCERLCRLLMMGILPGLIERDLNGFGDALREFNVVAGEPFAARQRGRYSSALAEAAVDLVTGLGIRGVGQSSWGPTVFAITDAATAERAQQVVRNETSTWNVTLAQGLNVGAACWKSNGGSDQACI
jgi:predicted sugar kinase